MTELKSEEWRKKYYDSVRTIEQDELQHQELLQTLKKLISRLCLVANGQSPRLDSELNKLKEAIGQTPIQHIELEKIGSAIAEAIIELDKEAPPNSNFSQGANNATPSANFEHIRNVLSRLLDELRHDAELTIKIDALNAELGLTVTQEALPSLLERISGLVAQRIRSLEKARSSLEMLLDQMVTRLDEMSQFIIGQEDGQQQQSIRREAFSTQVASEMQALGEKVDASADIAQIRSLLRTKLDSIGKHLQGFRLRESEFAREVHARSEKMRGRIEELEGETQKLQQRLVEERRTSLLDPLTQIPNRLAWDQRIADEMNRWKRFAQPTCIATWDIDRFKSVNDNYGHAAGDKVLKVVAENLATKIRNVDFIARYGGEEFVMILPGATLEDGITLVNQMRELISKIGFHFRGQRVVVTISGGITALRENDTVAEAFERADRAMYQAKETGRNRVVAG